MARAMFAFYLGAVKEEITAEYAEIAETPKLEN